MDIPVKDAKALGSKGERTRRRILDATLRLLAQRPLFEVRVTDVTRAAGVAQPHFYAYFASLEDALLAAAKEVSGDELKVHLEPDWSGEAGLAHARALVEAAIAFWRRNKAILTIVGVLADRMHGPFAAVRADQMRTVFGAFEDKIRHAQATGSLSDAISPRLAGYECVNILGSTGAKYDLLMASGFSHRRLVETTARLLHMMVTGERAPTPKNR
jgi:AcrR family transcriptional regulator